MMTFLPYPNYDESARVLDPSRLGNQAYREGLILLKGGWPNHPASKMWADYKFNFCEYLLACFRELTKRGRHYQHHIDFVTEYQTKLPDTGVPFWMGRYDIHASHRANLLRKKPEWYNQFGWTEEPEKGYVWPI